MKVNARSRIRVTAEQWADENDPLPEICFDEEHRARPRSRKPSRVGIGGPHVHLTQGRTMVDPFAFICPGDWIVRREDGSILDIMTDRAFRRAFEVQP